MEPLIALGLVSNVIQIVDFAAKLISNSKEIHRSGGTLRSHQSLLQAAENLRSLSAELQENDPKTINQGFGSRSTKPSVADKQLLRLTVEARDLAEFIAAKVNKAAPHGNRNALKSVQQAVKAIWTQKEMSALEVRLDHLRSRIDTVLLMSLRERLKSPLHNQKAVVQDNEDLPSFIRNAEKRHYELIHAFSSSDRNPSIPKETDQFSSRLHALAQLDSTARFFRVIQARLHFSGMPDRLESIMEAYQSTFTWIFDDSLSTGDQSWGSFPQWLGATDGHHLYWITDTFAHLLCLRNAQAKLSKWQPCESKSTVGQWDCRLPFDGKPGSGKSTLMKYLYQDSRTSDLLKPWAGTASTVRAGFFFWNSGTTMQMSRLGLVSSLLHDSIRQIMNQNPESDVVRKIFQDRWGQFDAFGGGTDPFKWEELRRAFNIMISNDDIRFLFMIDGLDEFDGEPKALVDFVTTAAKRPNVKVCVASRPWLVFEDAFEQNPSLLLKRLTYQDISSYVATKLSADRHFSQIEQREPEKAQTLISSIVDKASGVFLWVYLVVESILEGVSNADRMPVLQLRLEALPADLETLFDRLIDRIEPIYFRHSCQLFRLLESQPSPTVLQLSFADDDDLHSCMNAKIGDMLPEEEEEQVNEMSRRLKSRCKGLLETYNLLSPGTYRVRYLHRTAKDYLHSATVWDGIEEATNGSSFNADARWANAFLRFLKITTWPGKDSIISWSTLSWCLEYALRLESVDGKVRLSYLDEVARVADCANRLLAMPRHVTLSNKLSGVTILAASYEMSRNSFLGLCCCLGMEGYVSIKAEDMTKPEL